MKIAVASMFAMGLFVTACSIARLVLAVRWNQFGQSQNPSYDYASIGTLSIVESMSGLVCACMPGIANLLRSICPRLFGSAKKCSSSDMSDGGHDGIRTGGSRLELG